MSDENRDTSSADLILLILTLIFISILYKKFFIWFENEIDKVINLIASWLDKKFHCIMNQ